MIVVEHGRHVRGQVVNGLAVRAQVGHLLDRPRGSRHLKQHAQDGAVLPLNISGQIVVISLRSLYGAIKSAPNIK